MSYLARIDLTTDQIASIGIWDSYIWHKRLWDCCLANPEQRRDFLTRVDMHGSGTRAWLLSERKPTRPDWCPGECFTAKQIPPSFLKHRRYAFDLKANPVKAMVQRGENGERQPSNRVPLIKKEDLLAWLKRKALSSGFRIDEKIPLEIGPMVESHFRKDGHAGYHGGVVFRGILEVTDQERFAQTYKQGIGSAKAFGFGLLLLAPVSK